jgi:ribonuclease P protein component
VPDTAINVNVSASMKRDRERAAETNAGELRSPGQGFPAALRLLKHPDFDRVYKQGQRQFSTNLTVFYLRRPGAGGPRVGFTVSKALGGAVDRNRMKRRLREAVRRQWDVLKAPMDVVINPKRTLLRVEFAQITAEVERAFVVVEKRSATMKAVDANLRLTSSDAPTRQSSPSHLGPQRSGNRRTAPDRTKASGRES